MTEELKNAMRNATDEILIMFDKYNASKEDRKKLTDNLRIILVNQNAPIMIYDVNGNFTPEYAKQLMTEVHPAMESPKVAFVGSKMHSLLTDPEAWKQYLTNHKTKENKMKNEIENENIACTKEIIDFAFSYALLLLKDNREVARRGWNGKGMWIELQVPDEHSKMTKPYLYLNYPDNQRVPWLASQTDILATDWYEVK